MAALDGFREFLLWHKAQPAPVVSEKMLARLYRSHARLRVARRFFGMDIRPASEALVRGYNAGMGLFLTYSGAEALGDVVERHVTSWVIRDAELTGPLRKMALPLVEREDVIKPKLRRELLLFCDGQHENVRVVATALRHLVAHGDFSPTGLKAMSRAGANAIGTLSCLLGDECGRQFRVWSEALQETTGTTPAMPRR
jgi:hypothetical protein